MDEHKYTVADAEMLIEMMENPREPNEALVKAIKRLAENQSPKKVFYGVGQPTKVVVTRGLVDHQPNMLLYKSITYYTPE